VRNPVDGRLLQGPRRKREHKIKKDVKKYVMKCIRGSTTTEFVS
jgi:hypothetical protein